MKHLSFLLLIALLTSCMQEAAPIQDLEFGDKDLSGGGNGGVSSQDAFETSVYPITLNNCSSCHNSTFPQHASDDASVAHSMAKTVVDLKNPADSYRFQNCKWP